jgi:hypothetical protein
VWEYQKDAKKTLVPTNEQEQIPTALSCCLEGFLFIIFLFFTKMPMA